MVSDSYDVYFIVYGLDKVYEDGTGVIESGQCAHWKIFNTVVHNSSWPTSAHYP